MKQIRVFFLLKLLTIKNNDLMLLKTKRCIEKVIFKRTKTASLQIDLKKKQYR